MKTVDTRHHKANEFVKYRFFEELEHAQGKDPKTVSQFIMAIHEFELATGFKDFKGYSSECAKQFKHHLNNKRNKHTGKHISKSLYVHYLSHVKTFFEWLVKNEKEYTMIKAKEVGFLKATQNEANQARATDYQESHDVTDLLATIRKMPEASFIERRNKAMLSLSLLTSPRISSLQTTRIKSIKYMKDYDAWALLQNPKSQKTKFSKSITSFFVGQSQDIIDNVINWLGFLKEEGFEDNDYFFPRAEQSFDKEGRPVVHLTKEMIKSPTVIRDALKAAFAANNIEYRSPHKFRHSITRYLRKYGAQTDTLIALSENFGQKTGMAVLMSSYGDNYLYRQAELMKAIKLE